MISEKCCLCGTACKYEWIVRQNPRDPALLSHYECDNCGEFVISIKVRVESFPAEKEKVAKFAYQRKTSTDKTKPFVLYADHAELQELSNKDRFDLFQWGELVSRLNENGEVVKRHIGF